jgi:hypothetical protein
MIFLLWTHAGFMILAFCVMLSGLIIARFLKKKPWWLKAHRSLGITGPILLFIALFAIALQITLTGRTHFRIFHAWIGIVAFGFAVLTPTLGMLQLKVRSVAAKLRSPHRWSGRVILCLMFVNILLGLSLLGLI